MSDRKFPDAKTSGTEEGGKVAVHSLERDEKAGVFPADDFQGATRIVGAIHQKCTSDGVGDF